MCFLREDVPSNVTNHCSIALFVHTIADALHCSPVTTANDSRYLFSVAQSSFVKARYGMKTRKRKEDSEGTANDTPELPPSPPQTPSVEAERNDALYVRLLQSFLPSIPTFITHIAARMPAATVLTACIYVDRFRAGLRQPTSGMWDTRHRLASAALLLASKFHCDTPMRNSDWVEYISGGVLYATWHINSMEAFLLTRLDHNVYVGAPEMAAYAAKAVLPSVVRDAAVVRQHVRDIHAAVQRFRKLPFPDVAGLPPPLTEKPVASAPPLDPRVPPPAPLYHPVPRNHGGQHPDRRLQSDHVRAFSTTRPTPMSRQWQPKPIGAERRRHAEPTCPAPARQSQAQQGAHWDHDVFCGTPPHAYLSRPKATQPTAVYTPPMRVSPPALATYPAPPPLLPFQAAYINEQMAHHNRTVARPRSGIW